jgi:HEAT repeat protein
MRIHSKVCVLSWMLSTSFGLSSIAFGQDKAVSMTSEPDLIALIGSDAVGADKAMACKRLAIFGSDKSVPALAKLLTDEQLASWARIALEAIPGKASDEALITASQSLNGKLLIGVINSLGVRHDVTSVAVLVKRLQDSDTDVASASAVALGKIGNKEASDTLRKSLAKAPEKVRSAIAEGCVLCAERYLSQGESILATTMYDEVRAADVPKQRVVEATRGAILARKEKGIPLLLEQIRSGDKKLFEVGLRTAREIPGREVGAAMVAELPKATPQRAALIVQALADMKGSVDLPTIVKIASDGPKEVRLAAIGAIGRIGNASSVSPLLAFALEHDSDLLQSAKTALVDIQDEGVTKEIISRLPQSTGEMQQVLINVVGQRRIEATNDLVKALDSADQKVRSAALDSLGRTVPQSQFGILIAQAVAPKNADDIAAAQQALKMAAVRMPDREACAAEIAKSMQSNSVATKSMLLEISAAVGGSNALKTVGTAASDADPAMKDVSSRLLGDWMTIDAAPVLLDLAKARPVDKFQTRAMRGYIRIARQFVMSEADRVDMCTKAWEAATPQVAEQKLVLEILKRYPSVGGLKIAIEAVKSEVKEDATQAVQMILTKLGDNKEAIELAQKAGIAKP